MYQHFQKWVSIVHLDQCLVTNKRSHFSRVEHPGTFANWCKVTMSSLEWITQRDSLRDKIRMPLNGKGIAQTTNTQDSLDFAGDFSVEKNSSNDLSSWNGESF